MIKLIDQFQRLSDNIADFKIIFKEAITNRDISLDERWEVFVKYGAVLADSGEWSTTYDTLGEIVGRELSYYDDFYIERYQTVKLPQIADLVADKVSDDEWAIQELCKEDQEALINKFKEEVLAKGIYSFLFDW